MKTSLESTMLRSRVTSPVWNVIRFWWPLALVLWPVWTLFDLMRKHAINAPYLDDFMTMTLLDKARHGTLTLHDFFAAQMEHRIVVGRAVMVLFYKLLPKYYFVGQVWFNFALLCLIFGCVAMLLHKTAGGVRRCWPVLVIAALSLFSPEQFQIVLWPFEHVVISLGLFLTAGVLVWLTAWPVWVRFTCGMSCALLATLSFSPGILLWVLFGPLIWWCSPDVAPKVRLRALAIWAGICATVLAMYFHGLKNEVDAAFALGQGEGATLARDVSSFITQPSKSLGFALAVLGSLLARGTSSYVLHVAMWMGIIEVVAFTGFAFHAIRRYRDRSLFVSMLPWLILGAYSIGTALSVSMGRVWTTRSGINSLSDRYLLHGMPLLMALPALALLVARDLRRRAVPGAAHVPMILGCAGTAIVLTQLTVWNYGARMMEHWNSCRMRDAVNTLFLRTNCQMDFSASGPADLARLADDLGLLRPAMFKDTSLENFRIEPHRTSEASGNLALLEVNQDGHGTHLACEGYARLKKQNRVADGVLLTYLEPTDGRWRVFRICQVTALPLHLAETLRKDMEFTYGPRWDLTQSLSSFSARFEFTDLPQGVFTVAAWACDYRAMHVELMPGMYEVDTVNGTVKELDRKDIPFDLVALSHASAKRKIVRP